MDAKEMKVSELPKYYKSYLSKTKQEDTDKAFCQWASVNEIASEFGTGTKEAHMRKIKSYG